MARKNKTDSPQRGELPVGASTSEKSIWKGRWLLVSGAIAAMAYLLVNITTIVTSVRELPAEVSQTSDQFWNWYGDYEGWKGYWSNFPEGAVDMAEMNLSPEPFRISIDETAGGSIVGWMESKGICEEVPLHEMLLLTGTISDSRRADIEAFDFVGGHRRVFARLHLQRDRGRMTVSAEHDPFGAFSSPARLASHADDIVDAESEPAICGSKRLDSFLRAIEDFREQEAARTANDRN